MIALQQFLTTVEAARKLKISPGRVRQLVVAKRLIPDRQIGQAYLFRREKIEEFAKIDRPTGRQKVSASLS